MTAHTKVAGVWQPVTAIHTKVAGTWQPVTGGYTKVAGVWQQFYYPVITVDANWGANSSATPVLSATRTVTVPSGNPGVLTIGMALSAGGNPTYKKNAGANTAVTDGMTLAVANGDLLSFRLAFAVSGDEVSITVTDGGAAVGTWIGTCL
jgi:hypothetical protein